MENEPDAKDIIAIKVLHEAFDDALSRQGLNHRITLSSEPFTDTGDLDSGYIGVIELHAKEDGWAVSAAINTGRDYITEPERLLSEPLLKHHILLNGKTHIQPEWFGWTFDETLKLLGSLDRGEFASARVRKFYFREQYILSLKGDEWSADDRRKWHSLVKWRWRSSTKI